MEKLLNKEFIVEKEVLEKDLAINMGSGDLEVFSTPSLIAHMEYTAKTSIKDVIGEEDTTVGIKMDCDHLKASVKGDKIKYVSQVVSFDGKIVEFKIDAFSNDKLIGTCTHKRAIVNTERFMSKLNK